jgi:peroxiredoxin Q/BCP
MLAVGDRAPAFAVSDDQGRLHRSEDYAGRRLVLWFFPKASTPG